MPGLEFHHVSKSFGAVRALSDVSFSVGEGDAHAVVGENGAGKSTLLKVLAGIVRPDHGEIRWRDERLHLGGPREAIERGIGMVYQELLAFPNLTVAGNIFAGREITRAGGWLDDASMRTRTAQILAELHVPVSPDTPMDRLSTALCQLVQVARALTFECRVIVLDEPTTALTDAEVDHLFDVLADLRRRGVTILFVSHRLPEVFRLCDRITVMRDGQFVDTFARATTSPDDIVRAMVGREPPDRVVRAEWNRSAAPVLEIRGLTRRPLVHEVSLRVGAGEIVGIFGLVGSGRTELLETIFGLGRPDRGEIFVDGRPVTFRSAHAAARAGLALVPEQRQQQGLFFNLNLRHNLAIAQAAKTEVRAINAAQEDRLADAEVARLSIRPPMTSRTPDTLSGGNQQKVVAGKWLATSPRVLLLDEPTKGVDVGAKFEIHNIIRRQAAEGMGCLVVSSDLPEVLALADRVIVMREGRVCGELAGDEATEESVMRLATHEVDVEAHP